MFQFWGLKWLKVLILLGFYDMGHDIEFFIDFWWFNLLNAWFYWVWWILSWCIDESTKASTENTDQFLSFLYPHYIHKNYNFYKLKNLANHWFYWVFHKIWLPKYSCLYKPCQEDMGTHQRTLTWTFTTEYRKLWLWL